jgi:hypothetical protein
LEVGEYFHVLYLHWSLDIMEVGEYSHVFYLHWGIDIMGLTYLPQSIFCPRIFQLIAFGSFSL